MELQAVIITTEDGRKQLFLGYPLMEDEEDLLNIDETIFSNAIFVPDDATVNEALNLITHEMIALADEFEETVH